VAVVAGTVVGAKLRTRATTELASIIALTPSSHSNTPTAS